MKTPPTAIPPTTSGADLEELERLLRVAPSQPWRVEVPNEADRREGIWWQRVIRMADGSTIGTSGDNAADLIVAAVNALPSLLSRQRQLEAALAAVTTVMEQLGAQARDGGGARGQVYVTVETWRDVIAPTYYAARAVLESK